MQSPHFALVFGIRDDPSAPDELQVSALFLAERHTRLITKTTNDMVVDQTGCLHVRIDDCASDELEAALLEVFTDFFREGIFFTP